MIVGNWLSTSPPASSALRRSLVDVRLQAIVVQQGVTQHAIHSADEETPRGNLLKPREKATNIHIANEFGW